MPDTVVDFWRMLWETDSCIVVMLTGKPQRISGGMYDAATGNQPERYAEYWPLTGPLRYGQLLVELQSEYQFDSYILHEFKIAHVNVSFP
jgi:protein tyrosine phosphatase